ncbi:MAG: glutamate 5-kinase, partial [Planctomycetes bacterium]|nr:glutamate 5-kinase [Planctomycetota bacterium]
MGESVAPIAAVRQRVANARRVVVKVGTNVILRDDGAVALGRIYSLIESVATLRQRGKEVLLVSSGAVGLGAQKLRLEKKPNTLVLKQACAAIGQSRLMAVYEEGFEKLGLVTAQVLLTEDDFTNRTRYLNLSATLEALLKLGVVPILNENDTVSTIELETAVDGAKRPPVFGDNDRLSALVMSKIAADLLVILSDVDGLYTANPTTNAAARLVSVVPEITVEVERFAEGGGSRGRGGMRTKLEAARIAIRSGGIAVIANGRAEAVLDRVFAGDEIGTVFLPESSLHGKRRWIAYASAIAGSVRVNDGAKSALVERKASLLPAGVV